ncbi:aspartate/glutamate racemase family protein [Testudinibacter sp. TR-2022]|uniref:aspartate/glutamate racemase family protein n=1 Tax=Testudinibacter sp. TR-2022 TaxID=2585029 RepID=UPI00111813CD|nr:aspartate/glutamate racemase family protein [Testudinibacter sp. TR-2022]TNH04673.1 aspartate/glutamate racemase family protein [Pasteurellaceae bacterium Phil31]TNH10127.1 aspartate/glutamate racemase family protein [Testudinibacter sp. TR-2022]TNH12524.1 aspartate/glutamate racemase family protein [Testudinibacter sp. TR-2022]TNH15547.1 aspartate/glutamate racemase family protein [Testudinibacter sp. TR-2022]TNH17082.1 aspartate/glutamate racemase family protein [Testudinibacter sp. TR-20
MQKIGIIGGMSPESTLLYYSQINRSINQRLGKNHSADLLLHSVDFETIVQLQKNNQWEQAGEILAASAVILENMGAQAIILATNTMHKVAEQIQTACQIPLLHIIDSTALAIRQAGLTKIALLGTRFTMSDGFYDDRIKKFGIQLVVPNDEQQTEIHRIIFDELCLNQINRTSRDYYLNVIHDLKTQGAQGVILGCTEICLLINAENSLLPIFDSTALHTQAAVDFILGE